jgi:acetylornithine deacetylase/succinyl-diaminopimelate desuccinylase-like protein
MEVSNSYNGNPVDFDLFVKLLPEKLMFLIDVRPNKDHKVVHRSTNDELLITYIRRHRPSQWKPEFKVFIEGESWGSLNKALFDDVAALAHAIKKRGLRQVEF